MPSAPSDDRHDYAGWGQDCHVLRKVHHRGETTVVLFSLHPHGLCKAPYTNTPLPAMLPPIRYLSRGGPMQSPNHPVLQKLHDFDRSLLEFHNQLSNVLYGEEYARGVMNLEGDNLRWLVDYLDEVCCRNYFHLYFT